MTNKDKIAKSCLQYGLDVIPKYNLDKNLSEDDYINLEYPVMVKPVDGRASKGIIVVSCPEEMNEAIIERWNSVVSPEDEVYHLGDFFMGQLTGIEPILNRLNGKITLIRGNHDQKNRIKIYEEHGIEVKNLEYIQYKGRFFILCHFPIASEEFIRMVIKDNSEVVNLYGHVHSNAPKGYVNGTYHVGMDTNDLTPISIQQIWEECWPAEIMTPEIEKYKKEHENE
jgi:calcineurin-like phosphoesterase family protein